MKWNNVVGYCLYFTFSVYVSTGMYSLRGTMRALWNIYDWTILAKHSILDVWQGPKYISTCGVCFWTPALRQKVVLWFHHCRYVSMSVGKHFLSKMAHRIFLKLLMKLRCIKGKKLTEPDFWEKFHFGNNVQEHPKIRAFWILQKKPIDV